MSLQSETTTDMFSGFSGIITSANQTTINVFMVMFSQNVCVFDERKMALLVKYQSVPLICLIKESLKE